jgi:flagellar assembly factor FliW
MQPDAEVYVLTAISGHVGRLTTNLRSPLLLNLNRRLGCQVITSDNQPLQRPLPLAHSSSDEQAPPIVRQAA